MLSRVVNNIGVGAVQATFENLSTTGSAATLLAFTQALVDAQRVAAVLAGNNDICYITTTSPLFGAVLALSEELRASNAAPARATVLVSGVAEMLGTTGTVALAVNRNQHPCARNGMVSMFSTSNIARCHRTRGSIINVWDTAKRADVLF